MGIDDSTSYLNTYCKIIPWLNSIGFSLAAGSLFAKTYRAYKVLTTRFRITSPLKDSHLLAIVLILMAIEAILLTFWTAIDPLKAEKMAAPPISDPNRYKYKIVHTYWMKGNAKPSSIRFRMNENASSRMASEKYESAMGNSELMLSCSEYKRGCEENKARIVR
ncbi:uncharacterized protein TRIADDRAFT_52581 [Trichoplax adhaerens]|uniref:G-protein coupled receptors family 3 profile domain-containing protein n=1 Tax=Trichoplax adhaerens TaxID=10228 RepID=B3RJ60_TRIAD|nr:hypothetical protein TRIADDRAFT_52581 [Trichoplax adhaerens]EDV29070.1 hypothetical protein TRIADDRAFT_52581 [Trichoplax adhaerens]|eukprot:XP_002108272.1 hypothetical protein TRIADDRAFT_52581 [Trichoplax adhaerens]